MIMPLVMLVNVAISEFKDNTNKIVWINLSQSWSKPMNKFGSAKIMGSIHLRYSGDQK